MKIPLILLAWVVTATSGEPIKFESFFPHDTYFSARDDGHFGSFSGYEFGPFLGGSALEPEYTVPRAAESSNLPLYTDGVATPPQVTLSHLEKDYKTQLHKVSNLKSNRGSSSFSTTSKLGSLTSYIGRRPSFRSEPFPLASEVSERKPEVPDFKSSFNEGPRTSVMTPLSQRVELQTGFVPIIKNPQHNKRPHHHASTVLKDLEPPILTASSVKSGPSLFKVSASVQSSSKPQSTFSYQGQNSTEVAENQVKPRDGSYSRFLKHNTDPKSLAVSSSSSESVISRVISGPPPTLENQQKDFLRLTPSIPEDAKLSAKKTLEINCNGSRDLGWCELGEKYPKKYVDQVVASCHEVIERMYVEVPHSFEKLSETSNFKAELNNSSQQQAKERGSHDAWSWAAYFHQGSLCDSETGFLRPETAKDTSGKWNIIVQTDSLRQRIPIEMCRKTNSPCKKMLSCGLKSQCLQKYNYHLLLSLNPVQKHDCPFMKLYRFPSACVCHVE